MDVFIGAAAEEEEGRSGERADDRNEKRRDRSKRTGTDGEELGAGRALERTDGGGGGAGGIRPERRTGGGPAGASNSRLSQILRHSHGHLEEAAFGCERIGIDWPEPL